MTVVTTIEVEGAEIVVGLLLRVPDMVKTERLYDQIGAVMLNRIRDRFLRQEAPDGTTWEVSDAALRRIETGRDGGTLFDWGTLFHSIETFKPAPLTRGIGTDVPYSKYHQEGIGQVQRVFLGINEQDISIVEAIIERHIDAWLAEEEARRTGG